MDLFKLFGEIAIRNDSANSAIDDTTGRAEASEGRISGAFKKIGTAVVAGLAVDKIKDFAMSTVNASADVQSEASMFTATFGDMGGLQRICSRGLLKEPEYWHHGCRMKGHPHFQCSRVPTWTTTPH